MSTAPTTAPRAALGHTSAQWALRGIAAALAYHALYAAWLLAGPFAKPVILLGDDLLATLGAALAAVFCFLRVPGASPPSARSRQCAVLCGLPLAAYFVEQLFLTIPDLTHRPLPFPSYTPDIIGISSYPVLLLGIWRLPRRPLPLPAQSRIWLDSVMVLLSAVTFSWYFILGPMLLETHRTMEHRIFDLAYLLMDIFLVASVLLLGGRGGPQRRMVLLFSVGLGCVIFSDTAYGCLSLRGGFQPGTLVDMGWSLGFMLVGVAVATQPPEAETDDDDGAWRLPPLWKSLLPYGVLPAVAALVLYTEQAPGRLALKHGVFWGALALVCLVLARQVLALTENRALNSRLEALATADPLTGLCNHRAFHVRLAEEAARAEESGQPLAVAMLDLDNFKFFNDAYGHAAGDDVLRRVTAALRENALPEDTVSRFGGDEFALLLPLRTACGTRAGLTADALRRRLTEALAGLRFEPPGSPAAIPLTVSLGVALFPGEAASALDALELADRRLLHTKTGGVEDPADPVYRELAATLSGFPMLNALVTAVDNKDRYTRRHSEDVLTYSMQIARQFGLSAGMQRTMQAAALLHDVGKIGVPDRILRKPGALTEEEQEAIRQHPTMGAAIVGAVPGFEETLDTVRYHHERWDGGGYPAGLRGEETPLLARIASVADAFSAMTTDRPYRKGMEREKALGILRGGAGTQWDPECVAALLRAYRPAEQPAAERLRAA